MAAIPRLPGACRGWGDPRRARAGAGPAGYRQGPRRLSGPAETIPSQVSRAVR